MPAERRGPTAEPDTVARGSAPLFWAQVAGNAGLLVALVVITRALGPAGRGTIAFITVTAIVGAQVARIGVSEATTVFAAQRPQLRPALLSNVLLWATVMAGVAAAAICGGLLLLPSVRPGGVDATELGILGLGLLASALADAGYMFVLGCSRFRFHALVTVTSSWLYAILVGLASMGPGLTVVRAALIWVAVQALKACVLLSASACGSGLGRPSRRLLREAVAFGSRAWVGSLSTAFNERADQILIALIASEATLGIYATAVNGFEILLYLPGAAATALLPVVARAEQELHADRALRAFRSVALVTLAGAAIAAVLGPPLLPVVFGTPFEASAGPFLWLLPGAIGFVALAIFSSALLASSSPGRSSAGPLVSLVLGVILDLVLIPALGATGAAMAASAAFIAGGATALVLYRLRVAFPARALLVPCRADLEILRALTEPFARRRAVRSASDAGRARLRPR